MRPNYYSRAPYPNEPYTVHDNSRRENFGGSSVQHQDFETPGSGNEPQTPQHEISEEDNIEVVEKNNMKGKGKGEKRLKWSPIQDTDLCFAWLTTSNDGVKGTDQSFNNYWENIVAYYNQYKKEGPVMTLNQAFNHWYKMSASVSKFNGCYIQVADSHPSGHDDDQIMAMPWIFGEVVTTGNLLIYILGKFLKSNRNGNNLQKRKIVLQREQRILSLVRTLHHPQTRMLAKTIMLLRLWMLDHQVKRQLKQQQEDVDMSGRKDIKVASYANPIVLSDDEMDEGSDSDDESFTSIELEMRRVLKVSGPDNDGDVI
ncbi:hypothetical protein BVRB_7g161760 [Beta vulgaris subsp. vulgaris]|nr:hypothetical protein BVRB_7g161760 [Beta vulgaris subsp. vulgaris]